MVSESGERLRQILIALTVVTLLDLTNVTIWYNLDSTSTWLIYPWITASLRPIFVLAIMREIRNFSLRYLKVMSGSFPMVVFILLFVMYFSWVGQRMFSDTIEGVEQFDSFFNSFWSMFVLLTTSNFPMVMLSSYNINRTTCIFFIFYLILGLFLFMNLLLAIYYSSY